MVFFFALFYSPGEYCSNNIKQIMKQLFLIPLVIFLNIFLLIQKTQATAFVHPGIYQTEADLQYMKKQVEAGAQPWKGAFDRLVDETDLNFEINHMPMFSWIIWPAQYRRRRS
jgi:hypothetical protein